MCIDVSIEKFVNSRENCNLKSGDWFPIRKWDSKEPKEARREERTVTVKTHGKIKELGTADLKSEGNTIKRRWNYEWVPTKLKVKEGYLWCKPPKNLIGIFDVSQARPYFTVSRRTLKLSNDNLRSLGLLEGEMIRSRERKSKQYISFTNMVPKFINLVLKTFIAIGIKRNSIRAQPIINIKESNPEKKEVLRYWKKRTLFEDGDFVGIYRDKRYRTDSRYGSLNIKHYNRILRRVLELLLENIKDRKEKSVIIPFLQGLFAAEGSVNFSPTNSLNYVSLGVKETSLRRQYKRLLRNIGISPVSKEEGEKKGWQRGTGGYFMIQGAPNFKSIFETGILELYTKKEIEFLLGLEEHQKLSQDFKNRVEERLKRLKGNNQKTYSKIKERLNDLTKRDKEVLNILNKIGKADNSEISDKLGISRSSASRRMNSLLKKDAVKRRKIGRRVIWVPVQDP